MNDIDNDILPAFRNDSIDISKKVVECKGEVSNSEVKIFENLSLGKVRVVFFDNEPHFCLSDISKVLDIKNGRDFKRGVDLKITQQKSQSSLVVEMNADKWR